MTRAGHRWWLSFSSFDYSDRAASLERQSLLDDNELVKVERSLNGGAERIYSFLFSRVLVSKVTGLAATSVCFDRSLNRKPSLIGFSQQCEFNISHHDKILAGIAGPDDGFRAGLDLTGVGLPGGRTDEAQFLNRMKNTMTDNEWSYIRQFDASQRVSAYMLLWGCKESFLKAVGCGLAYDPRSVEICIPDKAAAVCFSKDEWYFEHFIYPTEIQLTCKTDETFPVPTVKITAGLQKGIYIDIWRVKYCDSLYWLVICTISDTGERVKFEIQANDENSAPTSARSTSQDDTISTLPLNLDILYDIYCDTTPDLVDNVEDFEWPCF